MSEFSIGIISNRIDTMRYPSKVSEFSIGVITNHIDVVIVLVQ